MSRVVEVNRYAVNRGSNPMLRDKGDSLRVMGLMSIKAKDYDPLGTLTFLPPLSFDA